MHPLSPRRVLDTALGFRGARALLCAAELGVFTELAHGPRTARQLCRTLGLDAATATDLLDALVAMALLDREADDAQAVYVSTREAAQYLDQRSPAYLGAALALAGRDYAAWTGLAAALKAAPTSSFSTRRAAGDGNPYAHLFPALASGYDFSLHQAVGYVDAAGEQLAGALRQHHPALRVSRFDGASSAFPGVDSLVLVGELGPRDAAARLEMLRRARTALRAGGCLISVEPLIDDARRSRLGALLASLAARLESGGGGGFTGTQFDAWCRASGFADTTTLPLDADCSAAIARV